MTIDSIAELRNHYPPARDRALSKQLTRLDPHCRRFIALSPFLVLSSGDPQGRLDASPRGGSPGFVRVLDDQTLLIPDARGNNRLDSLENIVGTGQVGLLFLVPGVDETLRVNGPAVLTRDAACLAHWADDPRPPRLAIRITVREAYLHCAKALMRSALWSADAQVERSALPSLGQMIKDQTASEGPAETQEEMVRRYVDDL